MRKVTRVGEDSGNWRIPPEGPSPHDHTIMQTTSTQSTWGATPHDGSTDGLAAQRRLVIPVEDKNGLESRVFSRFGHAPFFAVLDVDAEGQLRGGVVDNPCGAEHKPGVVPRFIRSLDADVVLAQKIGKTAYRALQKRVAFQRAAGQTVMETAQLWFEGKSLPLDPEEGHEGEAGCGAEHGEHEGCCKGHSGGHGGGCGTTHGGHGGHEGCCGGHGAHGGGCGRHDGQESSAEAHTCRCRHGHD